MLLSVEMAANLHGSCVKCGKTGGILLCNGCQQMLCFKHVNEHKDQLDKQLEDLINQQYQFENDISKTDQSHYLFNHIDQWKKESFEQIKQIAKQAKEDLTQLINQQNEKLKKNSEEIKEKLRLLKESEDLSEIELNHLTNQFNHLKKQIDSLILIKPSQINSLKIEKETDTYQTPPAKIPIKENPLPNLEEIHSKEQGSLFIRQIDPYGYFIIVEHNGSTTDKEQDMVGWTLKREIDSYRNLIYRFPNDFILKSKSSVKILSRQASQTIYSYEKKNILIAESIETWGTGTKTILNRLIDANGDERDILTQTLK